MTQRDIDADHTPLGRAIKVVEEQLLEMSNALIALQERVRHGELEALKDKIPALDPKGKVEKLLSS